MGLGGLDIALSGLRVAQQQLNVIANNVSNVNTEGYTRKILPQSTVVTDGQSAGVRGNAIIRNVDLNLERDFWTQVSTVTALEVKSKFLDRIQQFHGPPDTEISIAAEIGQLRDVFASLADSPEDNFLQRSVVDQAELVAGKINDLASLINEMRNDTQDEIELSIDRINTILGNIAELNGQIKFNGASGRSTAELEDQRDQFVKELSEQIDVSFFIRGDGVMAVQTSSGVQLVDERAETLFYNRTPIGPSSFYPDPNNPNVNGIFVGGDPTNNPVSIDITQSGLSGTLGALLELRDEIFPEQQAMLDELAHKMALRFQEQGLTLFTDSTGQVPSDSTANLLGTADLTALGPLDVATGPNNLFSITLNAGGTSPTPITLQIDLFVANTPALLAAEINTLIGQQPDAFSNTIASIDANGQLNITSNFDITIDASGAGEIGDTGLATLGLTRGTQFAAPQTTPLTPVPYVGFANVIQVNQLVADDNRLVQQGTVSTDLPVQEGSNEVIRRVIQNVFGDVEFQEAIGTVDLRASAGPDDLQNWLGIFSANNITSTVDLASFSDVQAIIDAGGLTFQPIGGPVLDQFSITFDDPRTGLPAQTYILDLEEIQEGVTNGNIPGANAAEQIAFVINNLPLESLPDSGDTVGPLLSDPLAPDPGFDVQASVNGFGQLVISSRANVTIDASFPTGQEYASTGPSGGMRQDGLDFLGLTEGTFNTTDPYIDVQIGNDPPVRITIEPGDDETDLFNKLNYVLGPAGVPGLAVDDDLIDALGNGTLILRPGDDPNNPTFGSDLKITGGPFEVTVAGTGPDATALGTGIVEALFGTPDPIRDVPHEISTGTGGYESFRRQGLGPNAQIDTGIISSTNLIDYAQKMINRQTAESIMTDSQITDETSFKDLLQRRLLDESGVNIEEELSNLIVMQTAFAAAARVISAIDEEFQELLNAVR